MSETGKKNPEIDDYIKKLDQWQEATEKMRQIVLDCHLTEDIKWNKPCYTYESSNIVIIQGFKAYIALLFFKGVLMEDPHQMLVKTGINTQVGRQLRFTDLSQIIEKEELIKLYIQEGIRVEKSGLKVQVQEKQDMDIPIELEEYFYEDSRFQEAFEALTPGRQRGYIYHFTGAKQSKTRRDRIEKCMPKIFDGIGFNDR